MFKTTFDNVLTVVFHAVAICTVTIATAVGASLLQPDATSATTLAQDTAKTARPM